MWPFKPDVFGLIVLMSCVVL